MNTLDRRTHVEDATVRKKCRKYSTDIDRLIVLVALSVVSHIHLCLRFVCQLLSLSLTLRPLSS